MKFSSRLECAALVLLCGAVIGRAAEIGVDADFPGGNVVVDGIDGDVVRIHPDLRDTEGDWFYWAFRVRGAAGRTVKFVFTQKRPAMTVRGAAVSVDDGVNWKWLGSEAVSGNSFTYTFADDGPVLFSMGMPYTQRNLDALLKRVGENPSLRREVLTRSRKGREVERVHVGKVDGEPRYRMLLTARHHSCEMMASYALEGLIEAVLGEDALGKWYRENVEVVIVPFVDKDGVEDGDQGKNRRPRDHNRDYSGESIYPETAALREWAPKWAEGKLALAVDVHCPTLRGARNEMIYQPGLKDPQRWAQQQAFGQVLARSIRGPLPYEASDDLVYGKEWNIAANETQGDKFATWAGGIAGVKLATTIEVAYGDAHGKEVNQQSARLFGRDLAAALREFAQGQHDDQR